MNIVNRRPTIFFVSVMILVFLGFSFLFVFANLRYLSMGSEIVSSQESDFLLIESASNLSTDWNKIFFLMDKSLEDETHQLTVEQEKFYLDQSRRNLEVLKDYYSSSDKNYNQNTDLAGVFLNLGRNINLLDAYLPEFYNYIREGKRTEAYNLRHGAITQLQSSLNSSINLFVDKVRQQNFDAGRKIVEKQATDSRWFVLTFLLYFFISVISPFLVYKMIMRYFKNLHQAVYKIISGDLSQRLKENAGPLEFCELSKIFNQMTEKLQGLNNSMEAKVKEKTLELDNQLAQSKKQSESLEEQQEDMEKTKASIMNVLEDINEERSRADLLAQDLQKFKLAVDNASDYIAITDIDGTILYANHGLENITGFKISEVVGKKVGTKDLWGGHMSVEFYQQLWETIKNNKHNFTGEFNNHRKNGEEFVAAVNISPILNGIDEVEFFVSIGRDITVAKRVDMAKTEFVSLASHQLRTPLTSVKWHAEMMLDGDAGVLSTDQKDFTQEIYNSNQRMIDLVDSLLDVSRLDLGTLKIEGVPTDILLLVKDLVNEVTPLVVKKKVKLIEKYDKKLPIIELDKKLSYMIIQNLLTNAVKYSKSGGEVTIEIKCDGPDNVLVKVVDSGYGIPLQDQDRIATKLFRADNARKTEPDGNGLGLYIVKSIINQYNGKFWFESKEGQGSTFYASLPIKLPKK
ncbi:MAG: ATP-binding protein [Candidatus Falkowbacteria bacterium]